MVLAVVDASLLCHREDAVGIQNVIHMVALGADVIPGRDIAPCGIAKITTLLTVQLWAVISSLVSFILRGQSEVRTRARVGVDTIAGYGQATQSSVQGVTPHLPWCPGRRDRKVVHWRASSRSVRRQTS